MPSRTRQRARAQRPIPDEGLPYLVFEAGGAEYALPLLGVTEIVHLDPLAATRGSLPRRGVTNLRGDPVAVVDLALALGEPGGGQGPESCALIATLKADGRPALVGLAVDAARQVITLAAHEIAPAPRVGSLVEIAMVAGLARLEHGFLPILDLERLLASEEVRAALDAAPARSVQRVRQGGAE